MDGSGPLSRSYIRIIVLTWSNILAVYALWVLMTYLTNVWKLNLVHATAIVNISQGVASVMTISVSFLVETLISNYWMLLLSSVAFSVGLGFLSMSTPPVLSKVTGTCSTYEPECIGNVQLILFYTALALIAIGMAGHFVTLGLVLSEQILARQGDVVDVVEEERQSAIAVLSIIAVILVPMISAIALPYIKPWSLRFGIPAICSVIATLIFVSGSGSYVISKPTGSPLTIVFRVFVASTLKFLCRLPRDANKLYERRNMYDELVPHTNSFRCLDKAAIIFSSQPLQEQEKNRWRLCRVTEVEETKITLRLIPMWITFIAIGLVLSIGNTFFLEQANHMNRKVGKLTVPLPILYMFYHMAKSKAVEFYYSMASCCSESRRKYVPAIGIALGMLFSILCCITAAKVENRRIGVIEKHGLVDKPDEKIPMTMFWLLPQFLLLGVVDGLACDSATCFFRDQVPVSMKNYISIFVQCAFGAGIIGGVLSVYIARKVSERGGRSSWFGETLNQSRLDNYYWTLAVLSSINLVIYVLVAIWYAYRESAVDEEEWPEEEDPIYDDQMWRCCL